MEERYTLVEHEKPYRYQEDGLTVTRGSAWNGPGCHLGCGVLLYTDEDGRLVKVEGDPENPFNNGRLCVRCLDTIEAVYNKDRLLYPMKRAREDRGKDAWERISWDEALDTIAENFDRIKKEYGAEAVIFQQGTGRDIAPWITRLCWSFGSPNYCFGMSGMSCFLPRVAGCAATTGAMWVADYSQQFADRYDDPEWECPEVLVVWGNNPVVANSDGAYGHWVIDVMKRGAKLIVVDPRRTWLANHSDAYLQIRPGTDAALAMGILNTMIKEELYDKEFVDAWCYGFDELAERVAGFTPEKTEEITWVPKDKIVEAARMIANARSAAMQWGVAIDMTKEAIPAGQAISAIFEITGNIDNPGGMIAPPSILPYSGGWGQELMSEEQKAKRIGLDRYALLNFGFQMASTDELIRTIETEQPYPIKAAWIQTTNPIANTAPDPERTLEAYRKLDFIACVDLFMTPTAMALADILLPAATYPERDGIRCGDNVQRGEAINKVISIGECKSDQEINLMLGKRLNPEAWPWATVEEMYGEVLRETGLTFSDLREKAPAYLPFVYDKYKKGILRADGKPGFNTTTGRIELWSTFYSGAGLDPLPYFEEPTPGPGSTPELLDEYPLVVTTGARNWSMFHSEHRQVPRMRAMHPDPIIQMNPKTAQEYAIEEGDWIWVENQRGRCKRKVQLTPIVDPRVCSTDAAWWFPEEPGAEEDGLFGMWDVNIGKLIGYEPGKAGFGSNYKTLLCKVYKVKEGE